MKGSGGQSGAVRGGRFATSRGIWFLPFAVRTLTASDKTVVNASGSRTKLVLVALAVRAPARSRTRRTLAGVGKAESMEFHGSVVRGIADYESVLEQRQLQPEAWIWIRVRLYSQGEFAFDELPDDREEHDKDQSNDKVTEECVINHRRSP